MSGHGVLRVDLGRAHVILTVAPRPTKKWSKLGGLNDYLGCICVHAAGSKCVHLLSDLGPKLAPFWVPKAKCTFAFRLGPQNGAKLVLFWVRSLKAKCTFAFRLGTQKGNQIGTILGPKSEGKVHTCLQTWVPKWCQIGTILGPKSEGKVYICLQTWSPKWCQIGAILGAKSEGKCTRCLQTWGPKWIPNWHHLGPQV